MHGLIGLNTVVKIDNQNDDNQKILKHPTEVEVE